jgi:hypothetical protein
LPKYSKGGIFIKTNSNNLATLMKKQQIYANKMASSKYNFHSSSLIFILQETPRAYAHQQMNENNAHSFFSLRALSLCGLFTRE